MALSHCSLHQQSGGVKQTVLPHQVKSGISCIFARVICNYNAVSLEHHLSDVIALQSQIMTVHSLSVVRMKSIVN
jgi:hypothetical protein